MELGPKQTRINLLSAEFFADVFIPAGGYLSPMDDNSLYSSQLFIDNQNIAPFKYSEVRHIIKDIKIKKAPGHNNITNSMTKNLPTKATRFFTILCNAILRLEYFPLSWKNAQIILIPKPGKPLETLSSYRPISLHPALSKICEKLIKKKILDYISNKNIIPNHPFGFRKKTFYNITT